MLRLWTHPEKVTCPQKKRKEQPYAPFMYDDAERHSAPAESQWWGWGEDYVCLEHLYPSLAQSLDDYIIKSCIHPNRLPLTFSAASGRMLHIIQQSSYVKLRAARKTLQNMKFECTHGSTLAVVFVCAPALSSQEH